MNTHRLIAFSAVLVLGGCTQPTVPSPQPAGASANAPVPAATPAAAPTTAALAQAEVQVDYAQITSCNIEQIDGQAFSGVPLVVQAGKDFVVRGFLFDDVRKSVPASAVLRLVSSGGGQAQAWEAPITDKVDRQDIPAYFKLDAWAAASGYEQRVSSNGLPPGVYRMTVTFSDGTRLRICDNGRELELKP